MIRLSNITRKKKRRENDMVFEKLFDFTNDRYYFVKTENGIKKFNIGTVKTFRNYLGEHEIELQLIEEPKNDLLGNEALISTKNNTKEVWHNGFIVQESVKDVLKQIKDPFFQYYHYKLSDNRLPDNVFFNDKKKATTLMFGKEATVVKCGNDDEYSRRIGFLEAYFQATCGLSKTKAKKYLENIVKDKEEKK